jgi:hypothetical protein
MPARKNRPDKFGVKTLDGAEKDCLLRWFGEPPRGHVWVDSKDVVHGSFGFEAGKGAVVRGLVTKGVLERTVVPRQPDWQAGAEVHYVLAGGKG